MLSAKFKVRRDEIEIASKISFFLGGGKAQDPFSIIRCCIIVVMLGSVVKFNNKYWIVGPS